MRFENQQELKTFFQSLWRKHIDRSDRTEEWKFLATRGTRLLGGEPPNEGYDSDDSVIDDILKSYIYPAIQNQHADEINSRISFGFLNSPEISAKIITVDGEHFVILMSHGTISYLRNWLQLLWAIDDPKSVIYCDQVDITQADSSTYTRVLKSMIDSYKDIGVPCGPALHLDDNGWISCGVHFELILIFLIAHELAHFLNGDFNLAGAFHQSPLLSTISEFNIDGRHELEFKADLVAFDISVKAKDYFFTEEAQIADGIEFFVLHRLFSGLDFICPRDGSHPSCVSRILNIVDNYDERILPAEFNSVVTRLRKSRRPEGNPQSDDYETR